MELLSSDNLRILVVEDNIDIADNIIDFMTPKGYSLDHALNGIHGLHLAVTSSYDVIVLDLMLPGLDGLTLCRKLREEAKLGTPVLMLTARDTLDDKLTGFESGADDYLVKPFAMRELAARIKALAGRARACHQASLRVADLEMDLGTLTVSRAGKQLELTKTCLSILKILMQASPNVVSRQDIEETIWGDMLPGSDALRSHIYTLRQKVDKPFAKDLIHTIQGIGYKILERHEDS